MQICTRCKKEFEERAHFDKQGRPFCDDCYQELIAQKKQKQGQSTAETPTDRERDLDAHARDHDAISPSPEKPTSRGTDSHSRAKRKKPGRTTRSPWKLILRILISIPLLLILLVIVRFAILYLRTPVDQRGGFFSQRPFRFPSDSMVPAIEPGGRFIVNGNYYRSHEPARWDIVVFKSPKIEGRLHVSRIVALDGEKIEIRDGKLLIDGFPLILPQRVSGATYVRSGPYGSSEYEVPPHHFFVLGDNGKNSGDSRYFGAVPVESLAGKVIEFSKASPGSGPTARSEVEQTVPLVITSDQIPMQVGDKWTFQVQSKDENLNGRKHVYSFYDALEHQGKTFFRRRAEILGVFERTDGLQLLRSDGWYGYWEPEDEVPYDVLKFPLSAGMEWEQDVLFKDKNGNKNLVWNKWRAEAEETIEVPAGTFRCIRVRYFNYTLDKGDDTVVWLAPEVGLVKFKQGGHTFNLVTFERKAAPARIGVTERNDDSKVGTGLVIEQRDFPIGSEVRRICEVRNAKIPDKIQEVECQLMNCSDCTEPDKYCVCVRVLPGKIGWYSSPKAELPFRSIQFPLELGSSWVETVKYGEGGKRTGTVRGTVVAEEMIKVPAGIFRSLKVVEELVNAKNSGTEVHWWIAPGVGIVKEEVIQPDSKTTIVLTNVERFK